MTAPQPFGPMACSAFRRLEEGEIVLATDEIFDDYSLTWEQPNWSVGKPAPNPNYTSHRQFRRRIDYLPNVRDHLPRKAGTQGAEKGRTQ